MNYLKIFKTIDLKPHQLSIDKICFSKDNYQSNLADIFDFIVLLYLSLLMVLMKLNHVLKMFSEHSNFKIFIWLFTALIERRDWNIKVKKPKDCWRSWISTFCIRNYANIRYHISFWMTLLTDVDTLMPLNSLKILFSSEIFDIVFLIFSPSLDTICFSLIVLFF